ncbi:MAG: DUF1491 family protein [Pseudomonadota bacterium]
MSETPRLKSSIRVSAHLRRAEAGGAFAVISKKGDADAGAVIVKIYLGRSEIGETIAQAHYESVLDTGERGWRMAFDAPREERAIDQWIAREIEMDPDLWVIEIDDPEGRGFLEM